MLKYLLTILLFSLHQFAHAQDFITRWDLSIPGSGATQLSFGVGTVGTCSYTWETIPAGNNGSGTFSGNMLTITGLPAAAMIRLNIDTANFRRININGGIDTSRLLEVEQWGGVHWNSMEAAFLGCSNLTINTTDIPDLSNVTNMNSMFRSCSILNGPTNINFWNTANVTSMYSLFLNAALFNQPIGNWNTSNVQDMSVLFGYASSFNQPIGNWNTGNVGNMISMFSQASSFNQPIGNWNTANVPWMNNMFQGASSFNQPIGNWYTANVSNMSGMFNNAASFNQPIGNWNVAVVTNMSGMFWGASSFNQPLANWNTGSVQNMSNMFLGASSFNHPIGNWQTGNVTNMTSLFYNASSFDQQLGNWVLNQNVNLQTMLNGSGMSCSSYSTTLNGWSINPLTPNYRSLGATNRTYGPNVQSDRSYLINTKFWVISGDAMSNINCCISTFSIFNDSACNSYLFNGQVLSQSGTYYDTLVNATGCDSLVILNLILNHADVSVTQTGASLTSNATGATYQWVSCNPYQEIISETSQSFTATTNGDYAVVVTQNGCTDTSACYPVMGIGLNEQHFSNNIKIFPNPVTQILQIESGQSLHNAEIIILNTLGQTISTFKNISAKKWSVDMSAFAPGNYFIQIKDANNSFVKKVMKE